MSPSALFVTTVPVTLEVFLAPYARRFRAQGWRIDGLANGAPGRTALADSFDNLYDIGWSRNPASPSNLMGTAERVRSLVRDGGYDIVHVHTPVAAFVTRLALRRERLRPGGPTVVYTAHGFHFYEGQRPLPHAVYRTMERLAARWTDYLVTINAQDHAAALALGTIAPERVRMIDGIGVDPAPYADGAVSAEQTEAIRRELDLPSDAFVVLMIAEFGAVKRHEHLLDALARVRDERVLVVFAGDGPLEAHIRSRVESLGLTGRVRFAGYRRDLPALLAAADALTLVSEREGLPRSVLEAMAAGKPVVGTKTRGITDAVGEDAGWLVAKNDAAALAAALDHVAAHPAECASRGAAGRARVAQRFSLDATIHAYEELYREVLG